MRPGSPSRRRSARARPLVVAVLALAAVAALSACGQGGSGARSARQDAVEARGAAVMPFDQNTTTHVFHRTPIGGLQRVVAKDAETRGRSD